MVKFNFWLNSCPFMSITNEICIGLMSGTSLDGLDIIAVIFENKNETYSFSTLSKKTLPYPKTIRNKLKNATNLSGLELTQLDHQLGKYFGAETLQFIKENNFAPSDILCVASHGHTIFHQPNKGFTLQIGQGAEIAQITGCTVVNNFRIEDVVKGGQGAPLVPIGDQLLFNKYDACINLGGFSNISLKHENRRIAFDISPCNLPLNKMASYWNENYDKDGVLAAQGEVNTDLFDQLNALPYYTQNPPKSLGTEWLESQFESLFDYKKDAHLMTTFVEHIAYQIAQILNKYKIQNALFTGGGTYNKTLLNRISNYTECEIIIPDQQLIEYKEALIFAFLGWLKLNKKINTLSSVTGSISDGCHGIIYQP